MTAHARVAYAEAPVNWCGRKLHHVHSDAHDMRWPQPCLNLHQGMHAPECILLCGHSGFTPHVDGRAGIRAAALRAT